MEDYRCKERHKSPDDAADDTGNQHGLAKGLRGFRFVTSTDCTSDDGGGSYGKRNQNGHQGKANFMDYRHDGKGIDTKAAHEQLVSNAVC